MELEIKAAHERMRQNYDPERLQHHLAKHGVRVGIGRIKRIREKLVLRCKKKRKFEITTDLRHKLPVVENLLEQRFQVYELNKVWVSDVGVPQKVA